MAPATTVDHFSLSIQLFAFRVRATDKKVGRWAGKRVRVNASAGESNTGRQKFRWVVGGG